MEAQPVRELRRAPRVGGIELTVRLRDDVRVVRGNISTGGVGFELDECALLEEGEPISVEVEIPELSDTVSLGAVIRHVQIPQSQGAFYVGASFVQPDEMVLNPLFRFVEERRLLSSVQATA